LQINNSIELSLALKNMAKDAISSVSKELLKNLQNQILIDIYNFDPMPRRWYYNKTGRPTYEFLHAFRWQGIKEALDEISNTLWYDGLSMGYEPDKYKHGSAKFGDLREQLAEILNVNGVDAFNNFGGRERRAYWDNFLREFFNDQNLDFLFAMALEKYQHI
jgi:hypothetical protein